MKRNILVLGLALTAAAATPLLAQSNGGKAGRAGSSNGVYDRNGDGRIDSRDQVNQGCQWWDVNCSGTNRTSGTINNDGQWHQVGRDQSGNILYQRRRTDGYGNVVVETARRDTWGRMVLIDSRVVSTNSQRNNGQVYGRGSRNTNGVYQNGNGRRGDNDGDNDDNGGYNNNSGRGRYDVGKGNGKGHAYGHYKNKNKNRD